MFDFFIDVSRINEKFKSKLKLQWKLMVGSKFRSPSYYTKFLVIREKNFTLIPFLLEEFGSSTISYYSGNV